MLVQLLQDQSKTSLPSKVVWWSVCRRKRKKWEIWIWNKDSTGDVRKVRHDHVYTVIVYSWNTYERQQIVERIDLKWSRNHFRFLDDYTQNQFERNRWEIWTWFGSLLWAICPTYRKEVWLRNEKFTRMTTLGETRQKWSKVSTKWSG